MAQSSAKLVSRKIADNAVANTAAALEAAEQLASAKTFREAAQLQGKFVQAQMGVLGEQANALLELSLKVAKQAADTFVGAAAKVAGDHSPGRHVRLDARRREFGVLSISSPCQMSALGQKQTDRSCATGVEVSSLQDPDSAAGLHR